PTPQRWESHSCAMRSDFTSYSATALRWLIYRRFSSATPAIPRARWKHLLEGFTKRILAKNLVTPKIENIATAYLELSSAGLCFDIGPLCDTFVAEDEDGPSAHLASGVMCKHLLEALSDRLIPSVCPPWLWANGSFVHAIFGHDGHERVNIASGPSCVKFT